MINLMPTFFDKFSAMVIFLLMIPIWVPKRRDQPSDKVTVPNIIEQSRDEAHRTKECAICRRGNADYEHSCGVAFHKVCIQQYFKAISNVDGAERICPHCYAPIPLDLETEGGATVEVSPIVDDVYNQYLELSDEFSLGLIDGRIMDVSVFLKSPSGEQYFVNIDFAFYPRKPTFSFPDDLLTNIGGLDELLEELSEWDTESPPRLVDILHNIESRIKPKKAGAKEFEFEGARDLDDEKRVEKDINKDGEVEFIEVFPEENVFEVFPKDSKASGEEVYEVEEILPATFFELDTSPEQEFAEVKPAQSEYENEEAIQQYLDLNNSFSVELVGDEIYHVIVHLSCLDSGIYNIYPITVNFREYPRKPAMTFTDDLLVRIRGLKEILYKLSHWDAFIPRNVVDIIQQLEMRLVEDSMLEGELDVIKREYITKRLSKNRIVITIPTYGQRFFDVEMNLKNYPSPPIISLPEDLKDLDTKDLEGIKKWEEKPQRRIMDVLRSLSQAINKLYRMEFEESLLGMIAHEFEVFDGNYRVVIMSPKSKEDVLEGDTSMGVQINLNIKVPKAYPLMPPEIEVESEDDELEKAAQVTLFDMLRSWAPNMFLADALNRLSLSLSNTSLFKCLICGTRECSICGYPLLTEPLLESEGICEMPCIHCKRPYHLHCLKSSIQEGITQCGYCLTDLKEFFGRSFQGTTS